MQDRERPKSQNMPQDSLRSVVYRSLITCNDPNGVVEYETMRKSKTGSRKKEQRIEKVGTSKDSIRSSVHKEKEFFSEGVKEESHVPPPFHVLEVSRGAQKLNLMIDSWSKGISIDGQSRDIARDLLKGALDLQESLVMLCKLQEASKYLGQMKKKHKQKYEGGIDDVGVERTVSDRFVEKHKHSEMQRGRLSLDGSSGSSVEELKNVIRDSLTRQNLLSIPSNEATDSHLYPRKLDDFSDIPSTSSSQSSMVNSNNSTSADWSVSCTSKDMKANASNVIAKLMGLEDFPSQTSPFPLKQLESKKGVDQRRPFIDIEMPNAQKAYFLSRNEVPKRKTLKEVIETMQLKGILKGNEVEGVEMHHRSSHLQSKHRLDDEMPPIVLIKPLGLPCNAEEDSLLINCSQDEGSWHSFRKLESREEFSNRRCNVGEGALEPEEMHNKLERKEEPLISEFFLNEEALNLGERSNKVELKEVPTKTSIQKERASKLEEIKRKQEVKESKTKEKASGHKAKQASVPLYINPQAEGRNNQIIDKVKKVLPNKKMPVEKENTRSVTMSRSPDQVRATSTKSRKPDRGLIITKNQPRQHEITTRNPRSVQLLQSKAHSSISQAKTKTSATRKSKQVKESRPTSSVTKKLQGKHSDKEINQTNRMESSSAMSSSDLEVLVPTSEETQPSKMQNEAHGEEQESSLCGVPTYNSEHGSSNEFAEDLKQLVDHKLDREETSKNEINLKELLLSSPSFLSCAEHLFELQMDQHTVFQTSSVEDINMVNTALLVDCANELMEYKSRRFLLVSHPLFWIHMVNPRTSISLEQLLGSVCDGINKLKNYIKVADGTPPVDSMHKMLATDIKNKGALACGVWPSGWEFGSSVDEADEVLYELENKILNELIGEIIVDYPNKMVHHLYS